MFSTFLRMLEGTLQRVKWDASQSLDAIKLNKALVRQAKRVILNFQNLLKDLNPLRDGRHATIYKQVYARFKWYFMKTRVLLLRSSLESVKLSLSLWISTILLKEAIDQLRSSTEKTKNLKSDCKI
jgi:hypothetical protein